MTGWTDERIATLKQRWLEHVPASAIAKELGGVSRNAVIGKACRLGLAGQGGGQKIKRGTTVIRAPKPVRRAPPPVATTTGATVVRLEPKPFIPPEEMPEDLASRPFLTDLRRGLCRWPIGRQTGADQRFCGHACADDETSYCADHKRLACGKSVGSAADLARSLRRVA